MIFRDILGLSNIARRRNSIGLTLNAKYITEEYIIDICETVVIMDFIRLKHQSLCHKYENIYLFLNDLWLDIAMLDEGYITNRILHYMRYNFIRKNSIIYIKYY
jgi:hypothetical protein